ncbi:DUF4190 domain-containing protein [Sediminibacillus massiliensis]|uniref:DUF4190 domain-containing protein n=1 Tax=Sediminibacillus massiliensis TaxID=1926277 RepID=UPI0009886803|nr:DUF4190 domain-containing protein [Sediminibacillus massiliensis]
MKTNSNAVIALILGILCIVIPFIGLAFGIAGIIYYRKALNEIEQTNEGGKGFASAGIVCCIAGIILEVIGLFIVFSRFFFW